MHTKVHTSNTCMNSHRPHPAFVNCGKAIILLVTLDHGETQKDNVSYFRSIYTKVRVMKMSYNLEEICFLANVAMVLSVNPVQLMIHVHMYPNNFDTVYHVKEDE